MSEFQRGIATRITFEIEYPDGSTKTAHVEDASNVSSISFDASSLAERDLPTFNVSESDWKQNPAMIINMRGGADEVIPGQIPFCTHNGCK
jgi:hypothetical protein